jgi:transitional endoplasmic reticulum ATPase
VKSRYQFVGKGKSLQVEVVATEPPQLVQISKTTEIEIQQSVDIQLEHLPKEENSPIGGMHDALKSLREMVVLPFSHPQVFQHLHLECPKGIIT